MFSKFQHVFNRNLSSHSTIQKYFGGIEENPLLYRLKTYLKFRNSLHIWVDHSRGLEEPSLFSIRTALRCVPHSYNIWRQFAAQGVTAQSSLGGPGVKTWHRVLSDVTSQGAQHKLERIILEFSFLCKMLW